MGCEASQENDLASRRRAWENAHPQERRCFAECPLITDQPPQSQEVVSVRFWSMGARSHVSAFVSGTAPKGKRHQTCTRPIDGMVSASPSNASPVKDSGEAVHRFRNQSARLFQGVGPNRAASGHHAPFAAPRERTKSNYQRIQCGLPMGKALFQNGVARKGACLIRKLLQHFEHEAFLPVNGMGVARHVLHFIAWCGPWRAFFCPIRAIIAWQPPWPQSETPYAPRLCP